MTKTLKVVIPMAGWGTRMRPHTWSKPKPLVSVGGKTSLEHLMDMFSSLPAGWEVEYIFIVGPFLGELQIPAFIQQYYPNLKARYITQQEMKGQSHAIWLCREHLSGPMIMCFSDTLMETDFSFLENEASDGVAWVKPVLDPRRFGVAELNADGWVTRFIEKPQSMENNLVVVGCYYFKQSEQLLAAIETQIKNNVMLKNEFFLTDAISIMIEQGAHIRTRAVGTWLDTGTIEATLETNRYLLENGHANTEELDANGNTFVAPIFIHPSAKISDSVIGPFASIGADCVIQSAQVEDSILEAGCTVENVRLVGSLIGKQARVSSPVPQQAALKLNIGDTSSIEF